MRLGYSHCSAERPCTFALVLSRDRVHVGLAFRFRLLCNTLALDSLYYCEMITQTRRASLAGAATNANFEELYHAELPRIYNYFCYCVGDNQLAEDLTSVTFEKAWRNRERYRHDLAAFSTWLMSIARRVAGDYYRKHH